MTNPKDLICEMKRIRTENGYSYSDIRKMMESNGDTPLSDATLSRIFAEGSESNRSFSYDFTLIPLARALLGIEDIDANDEESVKALKELNRLKHARIRELEQELNREKLKRHEQLEEVREQSRKSIEFLKNQISYKDERMNEFSSRVERLLDMINRKDERIEQLTSDILALKDIKEKIDTCPYRKEKECKNED